MDIQAILLLIVTALNLILGTLIVTHKRNIANTAYTFFCVSCALWSGSLSFFRLVADLGTAMFLMRLSYVAAIGIASFIFYFALNFPTQIATKVKIYTIFILSFSFSFIILSTNFLTKDIFFTPWGKNIIVGFWSHTLYAMYFLCLFCGALSIIWHKYRKFVGKIKTQLLYIFIGIVIPGVPGVFFNLILPSGWFADFKLIWIGPFCSLLMVVIIAYAIVKHRLMDIKFVLRRSLVYLSSFFSLLIPIIIFQYLIAAPLFPDLVDITGIVTMIIAVLLFSPLKHYYYRVANKYFFSSLYDPQQVIAEISDKLRSTLEVHQICSMVCKILVDAFHTKKIGVLTFDTEHEQYLVTYNQGFQIGDQKTFSNDKILHSIYVNKNESMVVEEIKDRLYQRTKPTVDMLRGLEVEILTPLNIKKKNIGLIALGPKESGDMYNSEDLRVLKVVGAQTAVALQNALLYEESLAFGRKLKVEVQKATHDLRIANQRLKELDKLKTEFMSLASHQLRTPLSGIKGYLSMMLEGDYGQLKSNQTKVIQELYDNNERLVRLVNQFLNISRIESGRLALSKEKLRLEELVGKAVFQMKTSAESKGLYLNFVKPAQPTPQLEADHDKLMDVVLNLIDNAIKYTEQGGITLEVLEQDKKVVVKVKDTGVGIDKQELAKLFIKFGRGAEASQMSAAGLGLGLFIAKEIIELHGGRIKAESPGPGKGSTFSFELPIK